VQQVWVGRAPFGYAITGDRYRKTLVPAATADYVPAIYALATQSDLSNATYSGTHTSSCVECGGSHDITVPAPVDIATQRRARLLGRGRPTGSSLRIVS